jgi:hypothetical protein
MPNLLKQGSAWLARTMATHAAEEVHYLRGDSSVVVRATVGRSLYEQAGDDGYQTRTAARDYLIPAADLTVDDVPAEPQPGDRVVEGGLEAGQVYEVMAVAGEPCWRWSDDHRQVMRVHTKYVGQLPLAE